MYIINLNPNPKNMNFWEDHSIMYIIGLVVCPRIILLWFGMIPAQQFPPILGFLFFPRLLIASHLSQVYGDSNGTLVVICWILAVIFDLASIIFKFAMSGEIWKAQIEQMKQRGLI